MASEDFNRIKAMDFRVPLLSNPEVLLQEISTQTDYGSNILYSIKDQSIIPYFALNFINSNFILDEDSLQIKDIKYTNLTTLAHISRTIPNNISIILKYIFNFWNLLSVDGLFNFSYVKNGVQKTLFIGPGIIVDSDNRILFLLALKKEIVDKINTIEGVDKFVDFYKAVVNIENSSDFLSDSLFNENAILLFSREFTQNSEYSRFYKSILSIFGDGTRYNIDMLVTDHIEKHIYELPISSEQSSVLNFKTLKEKKDYQKEITKLALLD